MSLQSWRGLGRLALIVLVLCQSPASRGQEPVGGQVTPPPETVVLPKSVPDPLEPLNRAVWAVNRGLMTDVVKPTSSIYRFVVPKAVRRGIGNFGKNLTYPGRLINNLLQGKWNGARDESYRFVCNTTVGIAGLFAVADRWKIPKSEADFGQTLGQWGWQPHCYVMLPFFGQSNERDTLGLAADTASNPLLYISPYKIVADDPLTYLGPYTYFTYAVMYNDLSDSVREYVRFSQAESDPYSVLQYAWTFATGKPGGGFPGKGRTGPGPPRNHRISFLYLQRSRLPQPRRYPVGFDSVHRSEIEVHVLAPAGNRADGLYRSGHGFASPRATSHCVGRTGIQ